MFQGMRYVYAVYKAGSFSKAAELLYISQPSLSANIKREEAAVGHPIFDRSMKPLRLTEWGREYIRAAEQIMAVQQQFDTFLQDTESLSTGSLSIGGTSLFASWVLPELLAAFSRRHPGIGIELVEESSRELEKRLLNGEVDFVLDNASLDPEIYERFVYGDETLLLAVPSGFPVNESLEEYRIPVSCIADGSFLEESYKTVSPAVFQDLPFIFMKPETDTGQRAIEICRENHYSPKILFSLDQQMTCCNIASSGMGIAFISDTLIRKIPFHDSLVYYKPAGQNIRRRISLYWKKQRYQSSAMRTFLEELKTAQTGYGRNS